jgi:hypothetical protein
MDKLFIRTISSARVRNGKRHTVRVPDEWAERMARQGYTHVQVSERANTNELVLTPLREQDVRMWRLEQRRAANRKRARERYSS